MSGSAVLDQAEVDALLHGMQEGIVSTQGAPAPHEVRDYDLGKEARIIRGRLPSFETIGERFARRFRTSLTPLLRRAAQITAEPAQAIAIGDYLKALPAPTSLNFMHLGAIPGSAILALSPSLVFLVVDNYFGGSGRPTKIESRDFTSTENRIIQMLLTAAIADLQEAWASVLPISLEPVSSESNPHFVNTPDATAVVVLLKFVVQLDAAQGELHFVVPQSLVEPLRERLELGTRNDRDARTEWQASLREELGDAEVRLTTLVGRSTLTLAELVNLKPGDIVPCDFTGKVIVRAEDVPIMRGTFGVSRGQQAIKVEQYLAHGN